MKKIQFFEENNQGKISNTISRQWADIEFGAMCELANKMGYEGLEIACWGEHLNIDKAYEDDKYVDYIKETATYSPRAEYIAKYTDKFGKYKALYNAVKSL